MRRAPLSFLVGLLCCASAHAQENRLASDFLRQGVRVAEACDGFSFAAVSDCAYELATGSPVHIALGSLAPQDGFAFGLAFVEHYAPSESWRVSWNADVVHSLSGSWRAGGYMKLIHTPVEAPVVTQRPTPASPPSGGPPIREHTVLSVYGEITSLRKLFYFGPDPNDDGAIRSAFSERQAVVGADVVYPLTQVAWLRVLRPSLLGAVKGRFLDVRSRGADDVAPIDAIYSQADVPGLSAQPSFLQVGEGLRLRPEFRGGRVRTNYLLQVQQFIAGDSGASFRRFTLDLRHEFPIYRNAVTPGVAKDANGPDECFASVGSSSCPPVAKTLNRYGSVGVRLLLMMSATSGANQIPFYFQPTLGGSDIDGDRVLSSAEDYRYRGPHVIALQETFEHSLWGPLGVAFQADQGKVTVRREDLGFSGVRRSYSVGLTMRAGGFPFVTLSFAWGIGGHHSIGVMDSSLLGGSRRPSLQ